MSGGGTGNYAEAVDVVAGHGHVHHFYAAAGEAEGKVVKGAVAGPVYEEVEGGSELQLECGYCTVLGYYIGYIQGIFS